MAKKTEYVPTDRAGESTFAVLAPGTKAEKKITARWREYRLVYHGDGWGDESTRLWTLWLGERQFCVLESKTGNSIERLFLPDRPLKSPSWQRGPLRGKEISPEVWQVEYEEYTACSSGEESAISRHRILFDLNTMQARHERVKLELSD